VLKPEFFQKNWFLLDFLFETWQNTIIVSQKVNNSATKALMIYATFSLLKSSIIYISVPSVFSVAKNKKNYL